MTDCRSACIEFLKAGVAKGENGRSKLYELVDLGVGLLVEKKNKKFQKTWSTGFKEISVGPLVTSPAAYFSGKTIHFSGNVTKASHYFSQSSVNFCEVFHMLVLVGVGVIPSTIVHR